MSLPRLLLHLEGLAVLAASLFAYQKLGASWSFFALLFLSPDLFMLGYLINKRVGAAFYNVIHTYAVALGIAALGLLTGNSSVLAVGIIVCAHIGFDRLLGFGLKYPTEFRDTHLQKV
ncbi:MAG: DUF4260 domain-containing protein [Calditrichaeota bacterium]|nr:DUF4260 domain-containing protein [Calditrichota bacterium]MCB9368762.1 DUF4260 domain-containing protein [Calditrichota bacterium]